MDRPQFCLLLLVLIKILLSQGAITSAQQSASRVGTTTTTTATTTTTTLSSSPPYFQPALLGFRCEGASEQTLDGISLIEANRPVRITLFGEAFTTSTIVAFTTESIEQADIVDQVISSNLQLDASGATTEAKSAQARSLPSSDGGGQSLSANNRLQLASFERGQTGAINKQNEEEATTRTSEQEQEIRKPIEKESIVVRETGSRKQISSDIQARKFKRRLLNKNYDCTDHNRVVSYKLSEANIITPNVAVLTVKLPELEWSSSGVYYYFCLKQPPIPSLQLPNFEQSMSLELGADAVLQSYSSNSAGSSTDEPLMHFDSNATVGSTSRRLQNESQPLVWVHQGDEWWLTLKVEPPILSLTNDCFLIVFLLFLSAVTSGLNLGLMSLDMNELAVVSSCGDQRERSYARTIAPLRKRGNYLLCSLLLGNVMVNSTLTVILEEMTSGVVAVIGSTLAIVVLGEIVPQAFCARKGLAIGAKTVYLTYAFMIITFPLSYPISRLLDCVLGEEKGNVYDRERLMEFIRITGNHTQLEADEVAIISGALKLKKIKVDQIMTRIEDVFMLPIDCMLNRDTIKSIIEKGYSRIPIYEFNDRKQIVALILAKDLALLDPDDHVPLADMLKYCKHPLIFIEDSATLDVALNEFKTGKSHMAIVRQIYDDGEVDKYYEAIGVVTLEDVIEEVLQTEINDETDTLSDNRRKRRRTDAQVAHLVDNLAQQRPALGGPNSTTKF